MKPKYQFEITCVLVKKVPEARFLQEIQINWIRKFEKKKQTNKNRQQQQ